MLKARVAEVEKINGQLSEILAGHYSDESDCVLGCKSPKCV